MVSILVFVFFFVGVIWMALAGDISNPESLVINLGQVILLIVVGAIAAATMIIPGVSGSMMLMLSLVYYTPILNAVDALKNASFSGNLAAVNPFFTLLPSCRRAAGHLLGCQVD